MGTSNKAHVEGTVGSDTPQVSLLLHPSKGKIQNLKQIKAQGRQQRNSDKLKGRSNEKQGNTQPAKQEHACKECKELFNTKYEADIHLQQVHLDITPWNNKYRCNTCSETFAQKISLNVHCMFKHGDRRRYQCDKCDYEGPRLYHLKRHMKVHTDERQYVCSICDKGLKTNQAYRNHMVLHTNDGRFVCNVCNKAYNQKSIFEDHQRSHQEERNYSCNYCDAAFKTYKHVACHIRAVHLNDKRFICDLCGSRHMTGSNLKAHMKIHRDISKLPHAFHCSVCKATFRGFGGLSVHMRVIHAMNLPQEKVNKVSDKTLLTPHPTRRPVKLEYTLASSSEVVDDPEMVDVSEKEHDDIVYEEGVNFSVCKVKIENMEYEVQYNPETPK
nr:zinc finger protein 816-like [Cherax quadricarinatus]